MHKLATKILLLFFIVTSALSAQDTEIERLVNGELKMNFPAVYFKNNSTEYFAMPYVADSCFKYISLHVKDINSLVIWRDSTETEQLTAKRIKKLKEGFKKYKPAQKITILSMGSQQKISRHTIEMTNDDTQIQYLLSLNSVFDISKTRLIAEKEIKKKSGHIDRPRVWCFNCWRSHRFSKDYQRLHVKKKG